MTGTEGLGRSVEELTVAQKRDRAVDVAAVAKDAAAQAARACEEDWQRRLADQCNDQRDRWRQDEQSLAQQTVTVNKLQELLSGMEGLGRSVEELAAAQKRDRAVDVAGVAEDVAARVAKACKEDSQEMANLWQQTLSHQ